MIRRRIGSVKRFQHRGHREHRGRRIEVSCFDGLLGLDVSVYRFPLFAIPFLLVTFFFADCRAQENPTFKIDEDISRFAFSGGGRIAFATRHLFSVKKIQLQRDDIWIAETDGKKRRILLGEKFVRGTGPFSYIVRGLRWSPDGTKIAAELGTSEMINDDGDTREGVMTLLLDDEGREIAIPGADSVIERPTNAARRADGARVVYLTEQAQANAQATAAPAAGAARSPSKPPGSPPASKLFTMNRVKPFAQGASALFPGRLFSVVAWNVKQDWCAAIERDVGPGGATRLVALEPAHESSRALGTLEGYAGGLSISPSGKRVAYWIDNEQLEVREVNAPNRMARVRVAVGTLAWSADEKRVLVKRGPVLRSGGLAWVPLPPLPAFAAGAVPAAAEFFPQPILHDLEFRQFDIAPDGISLAVIEPGKRNLLVYPVM